MDGTSSSDANRSEERKESAASVLATPPSRCRGSPLYPRGCSRESLSHGPDAAPGEGVQRDLSHELESHGSDNKSPTGADLEAAAPLNPNVRPKIGLLRAGRRALGLSTPSTSAAAAAAAAAVTPAAHRAPGPPLGLPTPLITDAVAKQATDDSKAKNGADAGIPQAVSTTGEQTPQDALSLVALLSAAKAALSSPDDTELQAELAALGNGLGGTAAISNQKPNSGGRSMELASSVLAGDATRRVTAPSPFGFPSLSPSPMKLSPAFRARPAPHFGSPVLLPRATAKSEAVAQATREKAAAEQRRVKLDDAMRGRSAVPRSASVSPVKAMRKSASDADEDPDARPGAVSAGHVADTLAAAEARVARAQEALRTLPPAPATSAFGRAAVSPPLLTKAMSASPKRRARSSSPVKTIIRKDRATAGADGGQATLTTAAACAAVTVSPSRTRRPTPSCVAQTTAATAATASAKFPAKLPVSIDALAAPTVSSAAKALQPDSAGKRHARSQSRQRSPAKPRSPGKGKLLRSASAKRRLGERRLRSASGHRDGDIGDVAAFKPAAASLSPMVSAACTQALRALGALVVVHALLAALLCACGRTRGASVASDLEVDQSESIAASPSYMAIVHAALGMCL